MVLSKAVFFIMFFIWFFSLSAMSPLRTQDQPVCLCQNAMSFIHVFTPNLFPYVQLKTFSCLLKFNNQAKLNTAKTNFLTSLPSVSQTFHNCFSLAQYCHDVLKWMWSSVQMSVVPHSMSHLVLAESFLLTFLRYTTYPPRHLRLLYRSHYPISLWAHWHCPWPFSDFSW